jgi:hypothetical protein
LSKVICWPRPVLKEPGRQVVPFPVLRPHGATKDVTPRRTDFGQESGQVFVIHGSSVADVRAPEVG